MAESMARLAPGPLVPRGLGVLNPRGKGLLSSGVGCGCHNLVQGPWVWSHVRLFPEARPRNPERLPKPLQIGAVLDQDPRGTVSGTR